jgi:4-amino-4-deoxy-L-arabinose transferase-like glycosyltransferase
MSGWALAGVLLALTLVRLGVAAVTPLAPDEAYYWVWSHALAPGYLDHPPMVALWIWAGTQVAGQTALGVRLLGPLGCLLASVLLWDAGRVLFGRDAGRVAVLLLNASLLLGVGAVIMTPDTPLLVFWTASLWAACRAAAGGKGWWWLVAGLFAGLALDSKYTAAFLWVGYAVWVVVVPSMRGWLRRWEAYVGGVLGLLLFMPVVAWNASHGWAGLLKQGGRAGEWDPSRAVGFLGELIGGQVGLVTPLVFGLCMAGLGLAVRRGWRGDAAWGLLAALSVPPVLVFLQHALGDRVQGNWPAILYPGLALAAGGMVLPERLVRWAWGVGFGMTALVYVQATTELFRLPPKLDPVSLQMAGWPDVAGVDVSGAGFLAVEGYGPASEMAWLTGSKVPVVGTDVVRWGLTDLPLLAVAGQEGLLLREAGDTKPVDPALWASARVVGAVTRSGTGGRGFEVLRVVGAPGVTLAELPGR